MQHQASDQIPQAPPQLDILRVAERTPVYIHRDLKAYIERFKEPRTMTWVFWDEVIRKGLAAVEEEAREKPT